MTIEELVMLLSQRRAYIAAFLAFLPLACGILRLLHGKYRGKREPWKYFYSVIIYLSCIPGVFSLVISAYSLLFLHENLLMLDIFVYYLPVLSMIVTLGIINKSVAFKDIPGFDKIYGLLLLIGMSFLITIILDKLRVFVIFGGSIMSMLLICAAIFMLLKYGMRLIFGKGKK